MSDKTTLFSAIGYATIEPRGEVVAASYGTWKLTYEAGPQGLPSKARIRIHTDSDTDWAIPQFDDAKAADYMTLQAPEGVRVAVLTQGFRGLLLTLMGRALQPGERIVLTYGDRSEGGLGSRAQTFAESRRYFTVEVDVDGDGRFLPLPEPPCVTIVGGSAAALIVLAPSMVVMNQSFALLVKAQDAWGNPSASYKGVVQLEAEGVSLPAMCHRFTAAETGVWWLRDCRCTEPGLYRIAVAEVDGKLRAESNPILCEEKSDKMTLLWGDPHGGQLVMADKIPDFFRYARDVSGLAFTGYQPNGHRVTAADWDIQQRAERDFYQPGHFVPLPGFEWSGEVQVGGHHNVYFQRHNQPIRRSCHLANIAHQDDSDTDLPHIVDVHRSYRGSDTVIIPHVGGGRADLTYHDPALEPVIEVTSTHGTFEWFLTDALRRGYQVGFIGGSDGYTGRPGGEYPGHLERRFAKGGLTGLYAEELTIAGVLAALKSRHAYGTTGARILVRLTCDGHMMGDTYSTRSCPTLDAFVAGTAPLESVELYRGLEKVYVHPLQMQRSARRVRILWEGASRRTSYSAVIWDGRLQVSNGAINVARQIRFDSPRSYVYDVRSDSLCWHSETCGYRSGLILDVSGDAEFNLVLNTVLVTMPSYGGFGDESPKRMSYGPAERLSLRFGMSDLANGPKVANLGLLERRVTAELSPECTKREVELQFRDTQPRPGINPYWLRIIQTDGEIAWTSPVYVDFRAPNVAEFARIREFCHSGL